MAVLQITQRLILAFLHCTRDTRCRDLTHIDTGVKVQDPQTLHFTKCWNINVRRAYLGRLSHILGFVGNSTMVLFLIWSVSLQGSEVMGVYVGVHFPLSQKIFSAAQRRNYTLDTKKSYGSVQLHRSPLVLYGEYGRPMSSAGEGESSMLMSLCFFCLCPSLF